MPINTTHPLYDTFLSKWERCRHVTDGADAVKSAGEKYLPKLGGQDYDEYNAYKTRAFFYGATARTVQAYSGLVFRKDPTVTSPEGTRVEEIFRNVTLTGVTLDDFAVDVFGEVACVGRVGVYVALPREGAANARAYATLYRAENIVNWQTELRSGQYRLRRVVLREIFYATQDDPYEFEQREQYRDLYLDESGYFAVDVWREAEQADTSGDRWFRVEEESAQPRFRGRRLDFIPFQFVNASSIEAIPENPPLLSLVDANLDHYRLMADYRHGLHFCGLPTPWVAGFPAEMELKIGSATAWVSSDPTAKAGMLEFTGQGLDPMKQAIEQIVGYMASLGARLLEQDKRAAEAAETHRIRQSREEATVSTIANAVSAGLSNVATWLLNLSGVDGEATVELNTDLVDAKLEPAELRELVQAWQAGAISFETLYHNLRQGERTRPHVSAEEEKTLIEAETPTALSVLGGNGVSDGDGDGIANE